MTVGCAAIIGDPTARVVFTWEGSSSFAYADTQNISIFELYTDQYV